MNYPNKIKINNKNIYYGKRGLDLEDLINKSNEYYLTNNIALIYKKPTPIGILKTSKDKKKINEAFFLSKSTLDYNGIYKGNYIDFDAKVTKNKTSFPLSNLHIHQITHLKKVIEHGGISFLIIEMNNIVYLLFGQDIIYYIDNNNRKSIAYDYIKEKGFVIKLGFNPIIDYLKIVDKIINKEITYEKI